MNRGKYLKAALSVGLIVGAMAPFSSQSIGHAQSQSSAVNILANLSQEQREALENLEVNRSLRGLQLSRDIDLESTEEVTVIVEFDQLPAKAEQFQKSLKGEKISLEAASEKVEESHKKFKKDLQTKIKKKEKSAKDPYEIKYEYKTALNGVTITLPANEVETLLESEVVKAVYSELEVQLAPPPKTDGEEGSTTKVESIPFLNIDKLHKEGFTGEGVKVGVIDTGIDYNHPDLKEAYKGGYDFVDNDNDPMEATYEDWKAAKGYPETYQGSTYYTNHGTHVSGTIVGQATNDSDYKVLGVAPDAELNVYRVLGPYGSGMNSAIIAGIDRAVADGMDVINLSLGAQTNNPLDASSLAVNNAVLSGVTAVVAAGNSGDLGNSTLGSPGAAALALTVGASSAPSFVTTYDGGFTVADQQLNGVLQLMTNKWTDEFSNLKGKSYEMVDVGEGGAADYNGKDVAGKVAFVVRGSYALIEKMNYAKQNGAVGVVIYNTNPEEGHIPHYLGENNNNIPTFSLTNENGLAVKELFKEGSPTVTLGEMGTAEISGDELASFSSKGPSGTLYDIKPEVTAPGVNILSTVPSFIQNKEDTSDYSYAYQRLSGTSMASPLVAGVAALLLESNPNYTPGDIKSLLMNTADPLKDQYSVYEVGAGRVDPYQAIHSDTLISVLDETPFIENGEEILIPEQTGGLSFGFIPLGDEHIETTTALSITNNSNKNNKYEISVEYNVGAAASGSLDAGENGVKLSVPSSIKVKKNEEERINAILTIPKTAQKGTYEGYIVIKNKDSEEINRIPFGAKVVEEGIGFFKVYTPSISTDRVKNPYSRKATDLDFILNSPMERLDWVLVDPDTKEELGWITSVNATGAAIDYYYYIQQGFAGYYFPFTGHEKKPISYTKVRAEDGIYEVKMIGTAKNGKQFEKSSLISLENGAPIVKYDNTNAMPTGDLPIVELPEGQSTVTISGTIMDNEMKAAESAGIPLTQAGSHLWYGSNGPSYRVDLDENGKFSREVNVNASSITQIQYLGADYAGNTAVPKVVYYAREGSQYVFAQPDKESYQMGDVITYTFYANNLEKAHDFSMTFYYNDKNMDAPVNFKLADGLPEGSELVETTTKPGTTKSVIDISIPGEGVSGDVALFEVTVDTNADEFFPVYGSLFSNSTMQVNGGPRLTTRIGAHPIYPTFSKVDAGFIGAEGFLTDAGRFDYSRNYTEVGAAISVEDSKGNSYPARLESNGRVYFDKLPIAETKYTVIIDIPGHYTTYTPLEAGRKVNGIAIGEFIDYRTAVSKPGDINKDNAIDIHDAILVEKHWGTDYRDTDINFDGTTDAKDFKLLEKYYLSENDFVLDTPTPEEEAEGKTIESIKKALGITP
ncbi:S8 family serine peptidase [Bacillus sp. RO1]|uniref:S8 family serine peptidase n=1 Tax=Bacillus sp. RO1 TaxID=2722703 RepID=UPI00145670BB|nr:S8 family serine peptidase [Bacillus sp. RO1]NLP50219.1 S8 family serine peptidase [Bacillus sp. RO1]